MYEEDRVQALAMYNSMFDETDDETGLLQLLVSPTRQAVNLARSYDAKERKLQAHSQAREAGETAEEEPAYVQVIDRIREQAAALGAAAPKVSDDQFSLFEDAALDTSVFDDVAAQLDEQPGEPVPAPVEHESARYPDEDAEAAPAVEESAAPAIDQAEADASAPAGDVEEVSDAVDAFLADFSIQGDELIRNEEPAAPAAPAEDAPRYPDAEEEAGPAPEEPAAAPEQAPVEQPAPQPAVKEEPAAPAAPAAPAEDAPKQTVRKPRVFLLILYILLAVPVTLLCIAILLAPTLLSLSLAFSAITLGAAGLGAAFGSFSVIADILLVLGIALVVLALGVLLAWTFIWFVFGAIPGLIRGVIKLGRKWCYKEVEVQ